MKSFPAFAFAAAVLAVFPGLLHAARPAAAVSVTTIKPGLSVSTTVQIQAVSPGYSDFDALNAVNDPLFRSGSEELLKRISREDAKPPVQPVTAKPAVKKPVLRDAPNSRPRVIKHRRIKKPVQADPLKQNNTI